MLIALTGLGKFRSRFYTVWAVTARRNFQRSGVLALEYQIVPEEFFAWCAQNGQENNSAARGEYVSERLSAVHNSDT